MEKRRPTYFNCLIFLVTSFFVLNCVHPCQASKPSSEAVPAGKELTVNKEDKKNNADFEVVTTSKDHDAFIKGYGQFQKENYLKAAPYLFGYMTNHTQDDVDYEWAEFFFGISLQKAGLSHAAVETLSHLVVRKPNPKIVTYSLELLEEITRTLPFDEDQVIHNVVCDNEYGFIDKKVNDFIHYEQGLYDWAHGFSEWGDDHFKQITPKTYYYYKYLYQRARYCVYHDRIDEAIDILKTVLTELMAADEAKTGITLDIPHDIEDESRITLARLLYEKGMYKEAETFYKEIKKPAPDQAQNLLEMAWIQYRMGNFEKSMGLLFAFEAPSFHRYFTPEYYLLKSFIFKDVCHYQSALGVVQEFYAQYGKSISGIYSREKVYNNSELLLVLLNKRKINETYAFIGLLEKERSQAEKLMKKEPALGIYLDKIYGLQIEESVEKLQKQIDEAYEEIANGLLKYEEEANLMEYEVGIDLSQRTAQYQDKKDEEIKKAPPRREVIFPFQGEFWNDELDDFSVSLPNKCKCMEEWDIFFK